MMTRPWERALLARMQGHGGGLFFHLGGLPHYVCEGLEKVRTTWHGNATACQESVQPKAMWAPALVPPPLIGRHRSRCSWDVPVTPLQKVSRPTHRNASVNGDQPYQKALAGSYHLWLHPLTFHKFHLHFRWEERSDNYCTVWWHPRIGSSIASMVE